MQVQEFVQPLPIIEVNNKAEIREVEQLDSESIILEKEVINKDILYPHDNMIEYYNSLNNH